MKKTIIPIVSGVFVIVTERGTGGLAGWRKNEDHPNYGNIEDGQNIEKTPGNLRILPVTQSPVKYYQLKLM